MTNYATLLSLLLLTLTSTNALTIPKRQSTSQEHLALTITPASIYHANDTTGTFLLNTTLSTSPSASGPVFTPISPNGQAITFLVLDVYLQSTSSVQLVSAQIVPLNATGLAYTFDLTALAPSLSPYNVTAVAASQDRSVGYAATGQVYRLPEEGCA